MPENLTDLEEAYEVSKRDFHSALEQDILNNRVDGDSSDRIKYHAHQLTTGLGAATYFEDVIRENLTKLKKAKHKAGSQGSLPKEQEEKIREDASRNTTTYIDETAVDLYRKLCSKEGLKGKAEEYISLLESHCAGALTEIQEIEQVVDQVERIMGHDFVKGFLDIKIISGNPDVTPLKEIAEDLRYRKEKAEPLIEYFRGLVDKVDKNGHRLRDCIRDAEGLVKDIQRVVERASKETSQAIRALDYRIHDTALTAFVNQHFDEKKLKKVKLVTGFAEAAAPLAAGFIAPAAVAPMVKKIAGVAGTAACALYKHKLVNDERNRFGQERAKTELLYELDEDPTVIAAYLQNQQLAALDVFLAGMESLITPAFTMLGLPKQAPWVINKAVRGVVHSILKNRMDQAVAKLKGASLDPVSAARAAGAEGKLSAMHARIVIPDKELRDGIYECLNRVAESLDMPDLVPDVFEEWIPDFIKDMIWDFTKGMACGLIADSVQKKVIPCIAVKVMEILSIKPAELITGSKIVAMLDELHLSGVPAGTTFDKAVDRVERVAIPDQYGVPQEIKGKKVRRTDKKWSVLTGEGKSYYISLDFDGVEVWGRYDQTSGNWKAVEVDPESLTSWRNVEIYADGIKITHRGKKAEGSWILVKTPERGRTYIAFKPLEKGPLRWGKRIEVTAARSSEYFLESLTYGHRIERNIEEIYKL
ncbi:hypothetical protein I5Q34_32845 [Streptomyces sp. AV19]|uniref:hypothetical protein n=1 Tax=Streptomyces sp. AV19 TaxID=2793068 RepID=UPI0018FE8549|nr:hypothetical protein [Streptomyces sp. AV19]MBH1938992.1 hypothetical protein [Streptomyces sp. AV19]MDG4536807.1 hypothetical protein [Streptomyces sp. AV19]